MSGSFYSDPELYDLTFPPGGYAPFYAAQARLRGGPVLELACGSGQLIVPIAAYGIPAAGLDLSSEMLSAARARAETAGADVTLVEGDMRGFDLGQRFALVYVARNSLLHLHDTDDLLACFERVRRHLLPGGVFVFDVFNPSVRILALQDGERRPLMRIRHPTRGEVRVETRGNYDAAAQVTRATWYFSSAADPDFLVATLEMRAIFPRELPLLLAAGGLRLEERLGGLDGSPFTRASPRQLCICRPA